MDNTKIILRIAKFELSSLFYSPIAWVMMALFAVQSGYTFIDALTGVDHMRRLGIPLPKGATFQIFSDPIGGVLAAMLKNVYLYIPLLTMGLISKELSSGTIKLVMSSPISALQLVLGKFFAVFGYCLVIATILLLFSAIAATYIENVDIALILSCIFAFLLLTAVYCSIGLFISCLTSYQILAALGTFAVLGALSYVKTLGQGVPILDGMTYWLSISGRAQGMIEGLITTKDVLYFVILIVLFLAFAVFKISSGREVFSPWVKASRYAVLLVIASAMGYVSGIPSLIAYLDVSTAKYNTLTPASQEIVDKIDDNELTITTYVNALDASASWAMPEYVRDDKTYFSLYTRYLPNIKFDYVYFYDEMYDNYFEDSIPLKEQFDALVDNYELDAELFLKPEEIKKVIDLSSEENRFVRQISYKDETAFLRMFQDSYTYPSETEITVALKRLLTGGNKITFVTGNGERRIEGKNEKDFGDSFRRLTTRSAITNHGFDVVSADLSKLDIPDDTDVLVIASPKNEYSAVELEKIKAYLDNGGNAIITAEPMYREAIAPIASHLGVGFVDGLLQQNNKNFEPEFIWSHYSQHAATVSETLALEGQGGKFVTLDGAMGLTFSTSEGYQAVPFLEVTGDVTRVKSVDGRVSSVSAPVALAVTKQHGDRQQRILFTGDADMFSNKEWNRSMAPPIFTNGALLKEVSLWLSYGKYPFTPNTQPSIDNHLDLDRESIKVLRYFLVGVLPMTIFLLGLFVLIRRLRA